MPLRAVLHSTSYRDPRGFCVRHETPGRVGLINELSVSSGCGLFLKKLFHQIPRSAKLSICARFNQCSPETCVCANVEPPHDSAVLPSWTPRSRAALKTQCLASKVSNKQAVFLRAGASSGTVWQFQKTTHGKDGRVDRILGVGSPVFAGTEVRLCCARFKKYLVCCGWWRLSCVLWDGTGGCGCYC